MFGNRKREREIGVMQVELNNQIKQLKLELKFEKDKSTRLANEENEANKNVSALNATIGIIKNEKKVADKEIKNLTINLKECEKKLKSEPVAQVVGFDERFAVPVTPTPGAPPAVASVRLSRNNVNLSSPMRARDFNRDRNRTRSRNRTTSRQRAATPRTPTATRRARARRLAAMMHGWRAGGRSKRRFKKSRKSNRKKTRSKKH